MLESPNDAATSRNLLRMVGGLVLTSIGFAKLLPRGFYKFCSGILFPHVKAAAF